MNRGHLGLELQSVPTELAACIWAPWGARTLDSGARAPEGGRPGLELPSSLSSPPARPAPWGARQPCPLPSSLEAALEEPAALSCSWHGTQRSQQAAGLSGMEDLAPSR